MLFSTNCNHSLTHNKRNIHVLAYMHIIMNRFHKLHQLVYLTHMYIDLHVCTRVCAHSQHQVTWLWYMRAYLRPVQLLHQVRHNQETGSVETVCAVQT